MIQFLIGTSGEKADHVGYKKIHLLIAFWHFVPTMLMSMSANSGESHPLDMLFRFTS